MIPKIRRGKKLSGLVAYLLGPGEHNEHTNRHIVAGSPTVMREMWLENFDGPGDDEAARETALAVAHEIEIPRRLYNTAVRMKAKVGVGGRDLGMDVVEPARRGEEGTYKDAPVWHCVLALMPGEELSDEKWEQVAETFMERMGFTGTPDGKRAQARWVAVRHGLSGAGGEGQDHIHIAASLVREDGSKVSTYDYGPGLAKGDWKRADQVCGELEHEFGLQVLATRREGGGLSENSRAELERQKRLGTPETERERLRRLVRAHATAADSEAEFVTGLREAGISIRPRYAAGGRTEVTGYSVRWRRDGDEVGPWVGGGTLAGDLSLTALRDQQWPDSPEARAEALGAWMNRTRDGARTARTGGDLSERWQQAAVEAQQWRQAMAEVPYSDRVQWAYVAGQAAGVFAAFSEALEGDQPGAFAAAAKELTRSAQLQRRTDRYVVPQGERRNGFGDTAAVLLEYAATAGPRAIGRRSARETDAVDAMALVVLALLLILLLIALALVVEIARAHRARGEVARAAAVEHMSREHLDPVRARWKSDLEANRYRWDRDAADVFAAAAERKALRGADRFTAAQAENVLRDAREDIDTGEQKQQRREQAAAASPARVQRSYYSDLPPDQKEMARSIVAVNAAFSDKDLRPERWSDQRLADELTHRRLEVQLLAEDLATRASEGGPHTQRTRAIHAELADQVAKIEPAQQAQAGAAQIIEQQRQLASQRDRLARELEDTPRLRRRARQKLQDALADTDTQLSDLAPKVTEATEAATEAAARTGVPQHQWDYTLAEAAPQRRKQVMDSAKVKDAEDARNDEDYLTGHLQRELGMVEAEAVRRAKITPEQRAEELRTMGVKKTGPTVSRTPQPDLDRPRQAPDRSRDRDQGPGL
ncbi:relaxase/mobilization nuclease domain-containing protein [Nocardia niigatensis]